MAFDVDQRVSVSTDRAIQLVAPWGWSNRVSNAFTDAQNIARSCRRSDPSPSQLKKLEDASAEIQRHCDALADPEIFRELFLLYLQVMLPAQEVLLYCLRGTALACCGCLADEPEDGLLTHREPMASPPLRPRPRKKRHRCNNQPIVTSSSEAKAFQDNHLVHGPTFVSLPLADDQQRVFGQVTFRGLTKVSPGSSSNAARERRRRIDLVTTALEHMSEVRQRLRQSAENDHESELLKNVLDASTQIPKAQKPGSKAADHIHGIDPAIKLVTIRLRRGHHNDRLDLMGIHPTFIKPVFARQKNISISGAETISGLKDRFQPYRKLTPDDKKRRALSRLLEGLDGPEGRRLLGDEELRGMMRVPLVAGTDSNAGRNNIVGQVSVYGITDCLPDSEQTAIRAICASYASVVVAEKLAQDTDRLALATEAVEAICNAALVGTQEGDEARDELVGTATEKLYEAFGRQLCVTYLNLSEGNLEILRSGMPSTLQAKYDTASKDLSDKKGLAFRALTEERPVIACLHDEEDWGEYVSYIEGIKTCAAVPVLAFAKPVGVICFESTKCHAFGHLEVKSMQSAAVGVGIALELLEMRTRALNVEPAQLRPSDTTPGGRTSRLTQCLVEILGQSEMRPATEEVDALAFQLSRMEGWGTSPIVKPLSQGWSGCAVVLVQSPPRLPVVVKVGPWIDIKAEFGNYRRWVRPYIASGVNATESRWLHCGSTGLIAYTLPAGLEPGHTLASVVSSRHEVATGERRKSTSPIPALTGFFASLSGWYREDADAIRSEDPRQVFRDSFGRQFESRPGKPGLADIASSAWRHEKGIAAQWSEAAASAGASEEAVEQALRTLVTLEGNLDWPFCFSACIHGDLNVHNLLWADSRWHMIDFALTGGPQPAIADLVKLEASLKYEVDAGAWPARRAWEGALFGQNSVMEFLEGVVPEAGEGDCEKMVEAIATIRAAASNHLSSRKSNAHQTKEHPARDYEWALLFATLSHLCFLLRTEKKDMDAVLVRVTHAMYSSSLLLGRLGLL